MWTIIKTSGCHTYTQGGKYFLIRRGTHASTMRVLLRLWGSNQPLCQRRGSFSIFQSKWPKIEAGTNCSTKLIYKELNCYTRCWLRTKTETFPTKKENKSRPFHMQNTKDKGEEEFEEREMCYEENCSTCGKTSWGGCGRHVPAVYKRIPQGQHCQCKGWPGVKSGDNSESSGVGTDKSKASSYCTILWRICVHLMQLSVMLVLLPKRDSFCLVILQ